MYHRGRGEHKYHAIKQRKNTINQHNHKLFGLGFMEMIPSPRLGFLRGVFLANHSASTDNLTRTTKRQNTYQRKLKIHKRGPNKQRYNKSILRYKTQTRPGLVALYDQAWTGHCAMAQAPPSTNTYRRPLAPSKFFDVCFTEKNSIIAVAPCLRPWS